MRRKLRIERPSPALVVAIVALLVAVTGTAVASVATISALNHKDKKQVKKIADREIGKKAPGLSVATAANAGNASNLANKPASDYLLNGVSGEAWHLVGAGGQPAFQNGWSDFNNGFAPAAFYLDPIGRVHLKGVVAGGVLNNVVFTLPPGYRPPENLAFAVAAGTGSSALANVDVYANGDVFAFTGSSAAEALDGISFRVS